MKRVRCFFAIGLGILLVAACSPRRAPVALVGTVPSQKVGAVDFSLQDQTGAVFRLSSARGKVVVLSFLYTHCDDICPFVTLKLKTARNLLGPLAEKAEFVAVTTDPDRDSLPVIAAYSKEAGLYDSWHFLTGPEEEVRKVWTAYGIGVHKITADETGGTSMAMGPMGPDPTTGLGEADLALAKDIADKFGGGYDVSHSAPFWFVDAKGNLRAVLNADASPADIVTDVKALLSR